MKEKVAIVVTYNRRDLLIECVNALLNQTEQVDIMVIDNASTDGTEGALQGYRDQKHVQYINTGKNLGGAGGFNFGIRKAYEQGYKYFWIMDDDTIPAENALQEFSNAEKKLAEIEWGFLASLVMWYDKEVCVMNYPVQHDEWCKQAYFINEGLFPIKSTSFVSCYFRRNVVKNVGLPIKEFVIWKDDTEYTERISSRYPSYFVTASKVIHKIKNNVATPIEEDSTDRLWRYKYLYRNISYIMRMKGFKKVLHFYYATLKDIRRILKSDCNGKLKRISIILSGLISGWSFKPEVEIIED